MSGSFNFNHFNSFLTQASQTIACGTECQKENKAEQLKKDYLNSQTNLDTAGSQVQVAQKNYVTFTQGAPAYNNLLDQQLTQKAENITTEFQNNFNVETDSIETSIQSYSALYMNLQNVYDLFNYYKKENGELFKSLKNETSDNLTNERKTYYEDQGIDNLKFWYYYILLTIYVIFTICFAVLSIIYPSHFNWKYKLAIFLGLVVLPLVSTYLLDLLLAILIYVYELMPKNAHLTI